MKKRELLKYTMEALLFFGYLFLASGAEDIMDLIFPV
jgi:hypothetical protein